MRFAGRPRHAIATVAAVVAVVAFAGVTLASRMGAAAATATVAAVEVPAPPTSTSSTTSSTTTSTSTSTSTTVKPRPTPTAPPRTTAPTTTPPAPAPVVTQPPSTAPPAGTSAAERCAAARAWLGQRGLVLPAGWGFRCPGPAIVAGASRWGMACWNCEGNHANWIAVDVGRIGASDAALRYVVAHETCHAIEYMTLGLSTELTADVCAAYYGAPRP